MSNTTNRRAEARMTVGVRLDVRIANGHNLEQIEVDLHDFSPHGIGFLTKQSIAIGTELMVSLGKSSDTGSCAYLLYRVVRCDNERTGHRIGAQFERIVSNVACEIALGPKGVRKAS